MNRSGIIALSCLGWLIWLTSSSSYAQTVWQEDFESVGPVFTFDAPAAINGLPEWAYEKTHMGRLRFNADPAFILEGSHSATLDSSQDDELSVNRLTATIDLSAYQNVTRLALSFELIDHNEDSQPQDLLLMRGSAADEWIEVMSLSHAAPDGQPTTVGGIDLIPLLAANGQVLSDTFQLRFSQEDNFPAYDLVTGDGLTIDQIQLRAIPANSAALLEIRPLGIGYQPVQVALQNAGTAPLTSAVIDWKVDDVAQPPLNWSGDLAPGESVTLTVGSYFFQQGAEYTLDVAASLPNGVPDEVPNNDRITLTAQPAYAGSYVIDSGGGGDWDSFAAAAVDLAAHGVGGAVTIQVASGSGPYNEQVVFGPIPNTHAERPVVIDGQGEVIQATPSESAPHIIRLDGVQHLTLENLTVRCGETRHAFAIHLTNAAHHNTIRDCFIDLTGIRYLALEGNIGGIVSSGSATSSTVPGDNASYCLIENNLIQGGPQGELFFQGVAGISLRGLDDQTGCVENVVRGNTITNPGFAGVRIVEGVRCAVEGNSITRPNSFGYFYGILLEGSAEGTMVKANRISRIESNSANPVRGIQIDSTATSEAPCVISNNLIHDLRASGDTFGIRILASDHLLVLHNTIALEKLSEEGGQVFGIHQAGEANGIEIASNLISVSGTNQAAYCLGFLTNTSEIVSDGNVLHAPQDGNPNFIGIWGSETAASLAQWQTIQGGAFDAASLAVHPQLNADFIPTNLEIDRLGYPSTPTDLGGIVPTDFHGRVRRMPADPGAFAFPVSPHLLFNLDGAPVASGAALTLGLNPTGATRSLTFQVENIGLESLEDVTAVWAGAGASQYAIVESLNPSLAADATDTFTIEFQASSVGEAIATLELQSATAENLPVSFHFSGTALSDLLDSDGDGMNDWQEVQNEALGFDWQLAQADLVAAYFDTARLNGLYRESEVQSLLVTASATHFDPQSGELVLRLEMKRTREMLPPEPMVMDVSNVLWNPGGTLDITLMPGDDVGLMTVEGQ